VRVPLLKRAHSASGEVADSKTRDKHKNGDMSAGRKTYDNLAILLHRLAGFFIGIGLAATACREFPRAAGWLGIVGMFLAVIFLGLAQSHSKTPIQDTTKLLAK
jgi:hypothetical protein